MEKLKINHNLNKSIHLWGEFRIHATSGSYSIYRDAWLLGQSLLQSLSICSLGHVFLTADYAWHPPSLSQWWGRTEQFGAYITCCAQRSYSKWELTLERFFVLELVGERCWAGHRGGEHILAFLLTQPGLIQLGSLVRDSVRLSPGFEVFFLNTWRVGPIPDFNMLD